jgi:hypothetical protein
MPLVLRLERKVRRSPAEATAVCTPQVVQNASLPTDKEGGGSPAQKHACSICLSCHRSMPKRCPTEANETRRAATRGNTKTPDLVAHRKSSRMPAPNV